ncbi:hypothetical protein EW146_g5044 [Bondarzewia mesenterica]|uniref:NADAR domain-containing protein n=1 Tax=Bondarzewia mesenterica TaxID=1095465 RepID=A0A4V3XEY2_9AGAM|nr:hypothetical protein EW146_g5044 [Bondarzewia mesenterica]
MHRDRRVRFIYKPSHHEADGVLGGGRKDNGPDSGTANMDNVMTRQPPKSQCRESNMSFRLNAVLILSCLANLTVAHDNGMDMNMDQGMSLSMGNMIMYLHFTPGDNLWFLGWVPSSAGTMVGTCIGLFMLALLDRWMAAMRAVMEIHWHARAQIELSNKLNVQALPSTWESDKNRTSLHSLASRRVALPFIPAHDIPRGIVHVAQSLLTFLFMLAVMCVFFIRYRTACGFASDSSCRSSWDWESERHYLDGIRITVPTFTESLRVELSAVQSATSIGYVICPYLYSVRFLYSLVLDGLSPAAVIPLMVLPSSFIQLALNSCVRNMAPAFWTGSSCSRQPPAYLWSAISSLMPGLQSCLNPSFAYQPVPTHQPRYPESTSRRDMRTPKSRTRHTYKPYQPPLERKHHEPSPLRCPVHAPPVPQWTPPPSSGSSSSQQRHRTHRDREPEGCRVRFVNHHAPPSHASHTPPPYDAGYVYFGRPNDVNGWLSPWYRAPFKQKLVTPDGPRGYTFESVGQYVMARMAVHRGDWKGFGMIMNIIGGDDETQRRRIEKVAASRGIILKSDRWDRARWEIEVQGNWSKFERNRVLGDLLLRTGYNVLMEKGEKGNRYGRGRALMEVRERLARLRH